MVDYLINYLGFSKEQASTVTSKVSHLKSTQKPKSIIDFFKKCDLDNTQIRKIVSCSPKLLTSHVDKTLRPKFRVFKELGLSGSILEKLIIESTITSCASLVSNVNCVRELLGTDEKLIKVIERSWWALTRLNLSDNLLVLQKYGSSNDKIQMLLIQMQKTFVFPFHDCVPHLYETYTNASADNQMTQLATSMICLKLFSVTKDV
ncbi:uncharacterized protein [Rutidosis leptorrhynchoides]|uniref:uncharacterized protein n=1 Tax=Rutidosis leptorrhynchoides TaxID=125765 RepID=UPI003A9A1694